MKLYDHHPVEGLSSFIGNTVAARIASLRRAAAYYKRMAAGEDNPWNREYYAGKVEAYSLAAEAVKDTARGIAEAVRSAHSLEGRFIKVQNQYIQE